MGGTGFTHGVGITQNQHQVERERMVNMRAQNDAGTVWNGSTRQARGNNGQFASNIISALPKPVFYPRWLMKLQEAYFEAWEMRYRTYVPERIGAGLLAALEENLNKANSAVTIGLRRWDKMRICQHWWIDGNCVDCGMEIADWIEYDKSQQETK
jgi:hypothetical protein